MYGRKQVDQRFLVSYTRIFLKGLAQGLVLYPTSLGKAWRVGGLKRERILRIALVLGKVKTDASDLAPDRGVLLEPAGQAVL